MVADRAAADDHAMASNRLSPTTTSIGPPAPRTVPRRDAKLALLASLPLFARCRPTELLELGRAVETVHMAPAAMLQHQQDEPGWWTVIAEGSALATVDGIPSAMLRPGDAFGVPAPRRHRGPSGVTIMALTPMVLFSVDPRRWDGLADRFPGLTGAAVSAVVAVGQPGGGVPRKNVSKSPSTPAPCSVMPPSTTMV